MYKDDYLDRLEYMVDDITSAVSMIEYSMMEMEFHIGKIDEALGHDFEIWNAEHMAKEPRLLDILMTAKKALAEFEIDIPVGFATPKNGV